MEIQQIIQIVWPLIVIQLAFQIYALFDLIVTKKGKTKNLKSFIWVIILVFGGILGPIFYFTLGRSE